MSQPAVPTRCFVYVYRLRFQGPPAWGACWDDETDNQVLKHLAAAAHASVFHRRVLATNQAKIDSGRGRKRKDCELCEKKYVGSPHDLAYKRVGCCQTTTETCLYSLRNRLHR